MRRLSMAMVTLLWFALPATAEEDKKVAEQTDLEKLQGEWKIEVFTRDGMTIEVAGLGGLGVKFDGNKAVGTRDGKAMPYPYEFKLDEKADPKQLDGTIKSPGSDDFLLIAIYKLEGDRLTVCFDCAPTPPVRPDMFDSKTDSKRSLIVFTRVKN